MSAPEFGVRLPGVTYIDRPGAYGLLSSPDGAALAVIETSFGLFLPGGGLDPGEDPVGGLRRELQEEIGHRLVHAQYLGTATQYHWSEFYRMHFKKIGGFFRIQAHAPSQPALQTGHELIWLAPSDAAKRLTQEFQRWAVGNFALK